MSKKSHVIALSVMSWVVGFLWHMQLSHVDDVAGWVLGGLTTAFWILLVLKVRDEAAE